MSSPEDLEHICWIFEAWYALRNPGGRVEIIFPQIQQQQNTAEFSNGCGAYAAGNLMLIAAGIHPTLR